MKPNETGGFTLDPFETAAAQWAVHQQKPDVQNTVEPTRTVWNKHSAYYELPLGPGESERVFDAIEQADGAGHVPLAHRRPIEQMLVESGRKEPTIGYRLRRAVGAVLQGMADD